MTLSSFLEGFTSHRTGKTSRGCLSQNTSKKPSPSAAALTSRKAEPASPAAKATVEILPRNREAAQASQSAPPAARFRESGQPRRHRNIELTAT